MRVSHRKELRGVRMSHGGAYGTEATNLRLDTGAIAAGTCGRYGLCAGAESG